ncbi:adenosylcobinamide-GDP ribazoletransferase [Aquipuribacter nitratireducens]|uniref:Adenosylcobinamide-GDP ribazoletransferase n=1 Tax=Aquipuribacter nitratireducens TaxID=650104 RepID=A0ABW0GIW2_9MICO
MSRRSGRAGSRGRSGHVVDGLRLGFGTLTVLQVPAPRSVDRDAAAVAMVTAVLPGAVVGLGVAATATLLVLLGVPAAPAGVAGVGAGVLLTRFLHVDGLADTADGLVAGRTAERALEVMRRGDVGPAGATVLVLVLGGQVLGVGAVVAGVASGAAPWWSGAQLVLAWAASRAVLALLCVRGLRPARSGGLGAAVVGSVPVALAPVPLLLCGAVGAVAGLGPAPAVLVPVAAAAAAGAVAWHGTRRLGGLTGDVLGAGVEVALLAAILVLAAT